MEKEFRADLFKRWNALNGENCVHAANCLKDQVFNLKTIAYFAKSLRIPAKPDARPETILWGIRGKETLLKYSQNPSRELLNQTFDKLFNDGSRKQKKPANLLDGKMDILVIDKTAANPNGRDNLSYYLPPNNSRYRNCLTIPKLNDDNSNFDLRRDLQGTNLQDANEDNFAF